MPLPAITFASNPDRPAPVLAFGTGSVHKETDSVASTLEALKHLTFLDTAQVYQTEVNTGRAIKQSRIAPENLWLLSKTFQFTPDADVHGALQKTLSDLGAASLDAFLIHVPPRGLGNALSNRDAWKELEAIRDSGYARVLGVSNFLASDLRDILDDPSVKHPIEINQIEYHPLIWSDPKMVESIKVMQENGITALVYGALSPIVYKDQIKENHLTPVLEAVAAAHDWTVAEVLMLWARQKTGGIVITTSTFSTPAHTDRMNRVVDLFSSGATLSAQEMTDIDEAGAKSGPLKTRCLNWW